MTVTSLRKTLNDVTVNYFDLDVRDNLHLTTIFPVTNSLSSKL